MSIARILAIVSLLSIGNWAHAQNESRPEVDAQVNNPDGSVHQIEAPTEQPKTEKMEAGEAQPTQGHVDGETPPQRRDGESAPQTH